jgi:hypothetical protein
LSRKSYRTLLESLLDQISKIARTMADYRHVSDEALAAILLPSFELSQRGPVNIGAHAAVDIFRSDVICDVYEKILVDLDQGELINLGIKLGPKYNPRKPWLDNPPSWTDPLMPGRQEKERLGVALRSELEQQVEDFGSVGNNTGSSSSQKGCNPGKPWLDNPPKWQQPLIPGRQEKERLGGELRSVLEQQVEDFSSVGNNTGSSSSQKERLGGELRSMLEQQDLDFSSVGNNTGSSSSQ